MKVIPITSLLPHLYAAQFYFQLNLNFAFDQLFYIPNSFSLETYKMQQSLPIRSRATHVGSIAEDVKCRYVANSKAPTGSSKSRSNIGDQHFINLATIARFQGVLEGIRHAFIALQLRQTTSCS